MKVTSLGQEEKVAFLRLLRRLYTLLVGGCNINRRACESLFTQYY